MRLIDADALALHMADWQLSACSDQYSTIEEAIDAVAGAPTIDAVPATIEGALGYLHKVGWMQEHDRIMTEDVAPARHGRWMDMKGFWMCSECHKDTLNLFNYCPYCGAKMDGDADD